jgi:hypothetical protein
MEKKTCGECKHFDRVLGICDLTDDFSTVMSNTLACVDFEICPKPTVFQQITASPEVLAEKLVYSEWIEAFDKSLLVYRSTILGSKHFKSYAEAIAATVARLKEIAK